MSYWVKHKVCPKCCHLQHPHCAITSQNTGRNWGKMNPPSNPPFPIDTFECKSFRSPCPLCSQIKKGRKRKHKTHPVIGNCHGLSHDSGGHVFILQANRWCMFLSATWYLTAADGNYIEDILDSMQHLSEAWMPMTCHSIPGIVGMDR
jgi:hypothetical protein